jgi:hypothetical protein
LIHFIYLFYQENFFIFNWFFSIKYLQQQVFPLQVIYLFLKNWFDLIKL